MDVNDLLKRIKSWVKVIQSAFMAMIIFETILVIIIGVASNKIENSLDVWVAILGFCSLIYIVIAFIRFAYDYKFPSSIVNELISVRDLEYKNLLLQRQQNINEYINQSIQGLNAQTCSISLDLISPKLCDNELRINLIGLIQPLITNAHILFNVPANKKITIGIYIEQYFKEPDSYENIEMKHGWPGLEEQDQVLDEGILLLRDDLGLTSFIPKDLLVQHKTQSISFEIRTGIERVLNNYKFSKTTFEHNTRDTVLVCSIINEICSDESSSGVLFFIYENDEDINIPNDIPEVLSIFNRVISNYISNYNRCMRDRITSKAQTQP